MLIFLDRGVRIVVEEIKKIETFPKKREDKRSRYCIEL
jgi:hypothetical protein